MDQREKAAVRGKDLSDHTETLVPLEIGQVVLVQNQTGKNPSRWDKSGQVIEVLPFDQYRVKIDGTGRLSLRNRKFLRAITPYSHIARETDAGLREVEADIEKDSAAVQSVIEDSLTPTRRSTRTSRPPDRLQVGSLQFRAQGAHRGGEHR